MLEFTRVPFGYIRTNARAAKPLNPRHAVAMCFSPCVSLCETQTNGPAANAGLRGLSRDVNNRVVIGDVITSIDGQAIGDLDDLYRTIDKRQIGDTISVTIFRDEKEVVLPIKLTQLPNMTRTRRDF